MQPHHGMADGLYFCFACLGGVDAEGVVAHWRALLVLGEETRDGRLMGGTHANGIWFFYTSVF